MSGLSRRWSCEPCRRRKLKCDGSRPSCSQCCKKNLDCVYLGTRMRIDEELEDRYKAELERLRLKRMALMTQKSNLYYLPVTPPKQDVFDFMKGMSLNSEPLNLELEARNFPVLRPGAHETEESMLIDSFFGIKPSLSSFVHKRTYLRNYKTLPSFLRLAVCAAGATIPFETNMPPSDAQWYIDHSVRLLNQGLHRPGIECVQALLILATTASCAGEKKQALLNMDAAINLALILRLNIDPDNDPDVANLNSIEKETRRRCWWQCFVFDQMMTAVSYSEPILKRGMSTVKPLAKESLWMSSKPPESLQAAFEAPRTANDNAMNWHIQLTEIYSRIFLCAGPATADPGDKDREDISNQEHQLELELKSLWNRVPKCYWQCDSNEGLIEVMHDDPDHWGLMMALFFGFHGCMCLIMRRKAMRYLRDLALGLYPTPNSSSTPLLDQGQRENEAAFVQSVASARAMAELIALLVRSNAFLHHMPHFTMFFCLQGAMTLLLIDEAAIPDVMSAALAEAPWPFPWIDINDESLKQHQQGGIFAAQNGSSSVDTKSLIEEYLSLLKMMKSTRKVANALYLFMIKIQSGDWAFLSEVHENPSMLFAGTDKADDGADTLFANSEREMKMLDRSSIEDLNAKVRVLWSRRIELFGQIIRRYIKDVREAKEIGFSLSLVPALGEVEQTANSGRPPLLLPASVSGAPSETPSPADPAVGMIAENWAVVWGHRPDETSFSKGDPNFNSLAAPNQPIGGSVDLAAGAVDDDTMMLLNWLVSADS
ncbi:hypothetical protein DFJ73DRAFT_841581 [Zopfochytrium polystomum]|nr:hypothetical protein DFJ73DRAFT_841581 [Zopfochytrium polystomum]